MSDDDGNYDMSKQREYIDAAEAEMDDFHADLKTNGEIDREQVAQDYADAEENQQNDDRCREFRSKIMLFLHSHRFSGYLKTCGYGPAYTKKLETMDRKSLTRDLLKIKFLVQGKNQGKIIENISLAATSALESTMAPKLNGLTEDLRNDNEFLDIAEEIRIDQSEKIMIESPYKRLALKVVFKSVEKWQVNKMRNIGTNILNAASAPALSQQPVASNLTSEDRVLLGLSTPATSAPATSAPIVDAPLRSANIVNGIDISALSGM